ncbi:MAG TPA: cell division protein, partial [Thiotrichales bacterium]|nr:cell division protein [Thiotrichales bacterium]
MKRRTPRQPPPPPGPGASRGRARLHGRLRQYALLHAQVLISSLGRLWKTPASSLTTAAVIGIALA